MPYKGIWLITRKIRSVTPVHISLCWKGVLVSGTAISGMRGVNGFTRSRKRTVGRISRVLVCPLEREPLMSAGVAESFEEVT